MISIKRFKFNFINVPKNASTSIRRFFIDNVIHPEDSYSKYYATDTIHWSQNMEPQHAELSHMDVSYAVDNGLLDPKETIVGVVRNPIDRVLSLYLYRAKQGYIQYPSVHDFRQTVTKHGFYPDRPWQNQLQSTFLTYQGKEIGTWWLYDNLEDHIQQFVETYDIDMRQPLKHQNKTLRDVSVKEWVGTFYDQDTLAAVNKYYQKDIELYEGLKC